MSQRLPEFAVMDTGRTVGAAKRERSKMFRATFCDSWGTAGLHFMTRSLSEHLYPGLPNREDTVNTDVRLEEETSAQFINDFIYLHGPPNAKSVDT